MIKWAVCGEQVDPHSQCLSTYLNSEGIENEVTAFPMSTFDFSAELATGRPVPFIVPQDIFWLRIPFSIGEPILKHLDRVTQECRELVFCDGILMKQGLHWPRSGLTMALTRTFSEFAFLDTTKSVLIVGAGGRARAAASAAVTLGFKRVVFVSLSLPEMNESVAILSRTHFATTFETISSELLIEVASAFSLCIFANDETLDEAFRTELSFFNFLTPEGVVIDLSSEIEKSALKEAAQDAKVHVVPSDTPLLLFDSTWVEWVFHHNLDLEKFKQACASAGSASPRFPV